MTLPATSIWAAPRLSMRWVPVFRRNFLVWRKLAIPSLVGNIAEPLITLVAFGYGLGVLIGEMLWAAFKSLFTSVVILLVMLALGISSSPMLLLALPLLGLVGITFSCIALIFNALAKGYDFFTYYFTLFLTPTMFLSGVFFPRDQLPTAMRLVSDWLPLTAAVELIRPLFLGQWPAQGWLHLAVLVAYAVIGFWVALALTRKRFGG